MSLSNSNTRPTRPVLKNTYGKKLPPQLNETEGKPNEIASVSSLGGVDDDFFGDLDMSKSMFGSKTSDTNSTPQQSKSLSDREEEIDATYEAPLTPRSKLKAQLEMFEKQSTSERASLPSKSFARAVASNPFDLSSDDDDNDEEDDAFMSRFRTQFLSNKQDDKAVDTRVLMGSPKTSTIISEKPKTPILETSLPNLLDDLGNLSDSSDDDEYLFVSNAPQAPPKETDNSITDAQGLPDSNEPTLADELSVSSPLKTSTRTKKVSICSSLIECILTRITAECEGIRANGARDSTDEERYVLSHFKDSNQRLILF